MVDDNRILNKLSSCIYLLAVFDQNIPRLRSKSEELKSSMLPNLPNILYFSEHHFKQFELDHMNIDNYKLGVVL